MENKCFTVPSDHTAENDDLLQCFCLVFQFKNLKILKT